MNQEQKTACIAFADGCPRALADAARVAEFLKANGWRMTNDFGKASLTLINTCGGMSSQEEKCIGLIDIASRKMKKGARLVLFGCLTGISGERLSRRYDAELIPPIHMDRLDGLIDAKVRFDEIKPPNSLDEYRIQFDSCYNWLEKARVKLGLLRFYPYKLKAKFIPQAEPLSESYGAVADIKVVSGCMGRCSYCAIRFGEGPLRSKPMDEIIEEFRSSLAAGYKTIRLIGGDVGGYGRDNGSDVCALLGGLFDVQGDYKVFWDDFNPEWLIADYPELRKLLSENVHKVAHAGFPIQSGSNRILDLMKREYTGDEVRWHMSDLKAAAPGLKLTSHAMIGFPTESDADFQDTLDLLVDLDFSQVDVYKYGDRPRTEASAMPDKVPEKVKNQRIWRMCKALPNTCMIG